MSATRWSRDDRLIRENYWSDGPCVRVIIDPTIPSGRHRPSADRVHVDALLSALDTPRPSTADTVQMSAVA